MYPGFTMGLGMPGTNLHPHGGRRHLSCAQRLFGRSGPAIGPAIGLANTEWKPNLYGPQLSAIPQLPCPPVHFTNLSQPFDDLSDIPCRSRGIFERGLHAPQPTSRSRLDDDRMALPRAVANLYRATSRLHQRCAELKHEFDEDTRRITYAPNSLLNDLWRCKLSSDGDRAERHEHMYKDLVHDFDLAVESLHEAQCMTEARGSKTVARHIQKVKYAVHRVGETTERVKLKRELASVLETDLGELQMLLDEMNVMWAPPRRRFGERNARDDNDWGVECEHWL